MSLNFGVEAILQNKKLVANKDCVVLSIQKSANQMQFERPNFDSFSSFLSQIQFTAGENPICYYFDNLNASKNRSSENLKHRVLSRSPRSPFLLDSEIWSRVSDHGCSKNTGSVRPELLGRIQHRMGHPYGIVVNL